MIDDYDIEKEHRPMRILGIKASYQVMNQIYTTLISLALLIGQKVVEEY